MYVSLCNGYRDAEIREVAESGLRCVREVYFTLGNGPCCGSCLDYAQDIVDSVHGGAESSRAEGPLADTESAPGDDSLLMAAE